MEVKPKAYKFPATHYAKVYGKSADTIRRWMLRAAPFDQPERMAAWIEVSVAKNGPKSAGPTDDDEDFEDEEPEEEEIDDDIESGGARDQIKKLEQEASNLYKRYKRNRNDRVLGPAYRKEWTETVQVLRQMMKDTPKSERDDGKSVPIADVSESITRALVGLRKEIETIPQVIAMAISHLKTDTILEVEAAAKLAIDEVISSMEKAKFIL